MARSGTTSKSLSAQRRQARLAAELRSNLRKRKQQVRRRAHLLDPVALASEAAKADASDAPKGPGEPEGGPA
jgi:hypothetical protein